jgi:hypothetical protein
MSTATTVTDQGLIKQKTPKASVRLQGIESERGSDLDMDLVDPILHPIRIILFPRSLLVHAFRNMLV